MPLPFKQPQKTDYMSPLDMSTYPVVPLACFPHRLEQRDVAIRWVDIEELFGATFTSNGIAQHIVGRLQQVNMEHTLTNR